MMQILRAFRFQGYHTNFTNLDLAISLYVLPVLVHAGVCFLFLFKTSNKGQFVK